MLPMHFGKGIPGRNMVTVLVLHVAEQTSKEFAAFAGACKGLLGIVRSAAVLVNMLSTDMKAAASPFEPMLGVVV